MIFGIDHLSYKHNPRTNLPFTEYNFNGWPSLDNLTVSSETDLNRILGEEYLNKPHIYSKKLNIDEFKDFFINSSGNIPGANSFNHTFVRLPDVKILNTKDIPNNFKYIYPILIRGNPVPYFAENPYYISKKVIKDCREGLCKILFHEPSEGFNYNYRLSFIKKQSELLNLLPSCFGLLDGNALDENAIEDQFNIKRFFFSLWEVYNSSFFDNNFIKDRISEIKSKSKKNYYFLSLNKRARLHRIQLVSEIFKRKHWTKKFKFSLLEIDKNYTDNLKKYFSEETIKLFPIEIDVSSNINDLSVNKNLQQSSYINICTETFFHEPNTIFFSEKIFKPIKYMQPFILLGNAKSLSKLREMGYKTFHPYINEEYDKEIDNENRLNLIFNEIDRLSQFTHKDMQDLLFNVLDILIHNYEHNKYVTESNFRLLTVKKEIEEWLNN